MVGALWKELSPAARDIFDVRANQDKQRYLIELDAYNKVAVHKIAPRINAPPGFTFPCTSAAPVPARTLTAYSIFAQQVQRYCNGTSSIQISLMRRDMCQ